MGGAVGGAMGGAMGGAGIGSGRPSDARDDPEGHGGMGLPDPRGLTCPEHGIGFGDTCPRPSRVANAVSDPVGPTAEP